MAKLFALVCQNTQARLQCVVPSVFWTQSVLKIAPALTKSAWTRVPILVARLPPAWSEVTVRSVLAENHTPEILSSDVSLHHVRCLETNLNYLAVTYIDSLFHNCPFRSTTTDSSRSYTALFAFPVWSKFRVSCSQWRSILSMSTHLHWKPSKLSARMYS